MSRSQETVRIEAPEGRLVLGRYRLLRRLGAGGFGVVWLGRDEHLQREVAVKVLARDEEVESGRASREARAAARLNHPGIVALYELAEDDHDAYIVSELVPGRTMAELLSERALSDRDVARIGVALCEALAHAHARGVIHRDVKPGNVMVVDEPAAGAGFAKLADFGVAHMASGDPLTRTGDVVGTLAYMAPEQAEGARATPACDVYSLALSLYEGWTGDNPVRAGGPLATARRLGRPLAPLGHHRPDLPVVLCEAIDDALDPDPEIRPEPGELAAELAQVEPQLSDAGGLVEEETRERVGLTEATRRLVPFPPPREAERAEHWPAQPYAQPPYVDDPRARYGHPPGEPRRNRTARLAARVGAGLLAGVLVLAALSAVGPTPPFSPVAAAGVVAVGVALLPRVGWLTSALLLLGWLVSPEADREGTALLLAFMLAPVPLLLPRAGVLWSVPVLAPLLGAASLAPAFVALAALAPTAPRRAGLAAAGFLWLAGGEALIGDPLLYGSPDGTGSLALWQSSITGAASDAVWPLISSPALAPALVWAGFAAVLPLLVRGRSTGLDLAAATLWAVGLIGAHAALGDLMASSGGLTDARGALVGTLLGAAAAVATATALARRPAPGGGAVGLP
ncbi:MAG TPA: serine/threonine-protein kinase [Thermoleophilaceae bacterium]|nr:serine/threonine-protein kinase [Thermoleophilaceae bacterium]